MARACPSVIVPLHESVLDLWRKIEQAQRVGHGRTRLADPARDLIVPQAELVDQPSVGGAPPPARSGRSAAGSRSAPRQAGALSSAERTSAGIRSRPAIWAARKSPLAGDELVAARYLADEDRLENAVLGDAGGKIVQLSTARTVCRG